MRRQPTEQWSQGTRLRSRHEARGASNKRSRLRHLALEGLEARTLLATAPTPTVTGWTAASANFNSTANNDSSPYIAIDPLNSQKEVTVFTDRDTSSGTTVLEARVTFSNDGGKTWTQAAFQPQPQQDPTSTTPKLLNDFAQGVGFDRNNNFFVGVLETNGNNAGAVAVNKYSFSGAAPTLANLETYYNSPVYSWNQTVTNANLEPTVLNFSMAVDNNVATYIDPANNAVQTDPNSGAVYIAWTLNTPPPPNPPPWNPDTIQAVASSNGVDWPAESNNFTGDTGAVTISHGNFQSNFRYTAPQIAVSQGKANGSDGGVISVIFDDFLGSNGAGLDNIGFASLTYGLKGAGTFGLTDTTPNTYSVVAQTRVRGALSAPYGLGSPSSPLGIAPGAMIAVDNTLGGFSPNQGRIYVAYVDRYNGTNNPADNTDIFLVASDNDGATWFAPDNPGSKFATVPANNGMQVNDDAGTNDGHSGAVNINDIQSGNDARFEDGRPQYEPQIAVDTTTGTLAMSWLDVRDDPSLIRYADYLTTSIDGGGSFSSQSLPTTEYTAAQLGQGVPQPFANDPNIVTDAITGKKFIAGPYSGNVSGNNPNAETSLAFGISQGLAIANGVIHPVWSTTVQDALGNFNNGNANERLSIRTALATFPAGPRIVTGTMGVVGPTTVDGIAFNNVAALDGTDELTGFVVTFDRPVSIASFTPGQVHVFFNGTTSLTNTPVPLAATNPITALDPINGGLEATTFLISVVPQSAVGTYSYTVGPNVTDLMRTATSTPTIVPDPAGTASEVLGAPNVPQTITDPAAPSTTTISTITVSGVANGNFLKDISVNLSLLYHNDANLTITLTSPANKTVTLVSGAPGANFSNTTFSDGAPQSIGTGTAPYTGSFLPAQPLDAAFANGPIDGNWTLTIVNTGIGGASGSLTGWSVNITPQNSTTITYGPPFPATPELIPDSAAPSTTTTSGLTISNTPAADVVAGSVSVNNLTISYSGVNNPLTIALRSPSGQTVVLAAGVGALSGASLSTNGFIGGPINGTWTLVITDTSTAGNTGTLSNWSLSVPAGKQVSPTTSFGNKMDQNANGIAGQASDLFEAPRPLTGAAIQAPFDQTTEPLIIPGPHVVLTSVPNGVVDPNSQGAADTTLVLNGTVSSINVTFDRFMNAASFTPAQVLSIVGPAGPISTAGITVSPSTGFAKTFTISGFPTQSLSGTYSVVLGAGITSQAGDAMDANENAGLNLLFNGSPVNSTPTTTYPASSLPAAIGAGQTVISTIVVNDAYTITDLQLALDITHPNDPDLAATLTFTPAGTGTPGTPIPLFTNVGKIAGSKANFTSTVFTDATTTVINGQTVPVTPIDNGAPPYLGLFNPEGTGFASLVNGPVQGTYTLTITNSGTKTGTLNSWSIVASRAITNTGLGEPVADRTTTGFRIFTMSPTNSQSSNTWTAVGPASENNTANGGEVTAIAVDPSDPSGNTVYVGGAGGGIWRTTDYLTTAAGGPNYVPLTQNSLYGSLNIGSIAIFPKNDDPGQSVIIAGTGSLGNGQTPLGGRLTNAGTGFLISYNGGTTWTLLDSTTNFNGAAEVPEPLSAAKGATARDDAFVGTTVSKILVDPHAQPSGDLIFYAAVTGTNVRGVNEGGVWRSTDSGKTWQLKRAGQATDIVFDPNSGAVDTVSNPTGNFSVLYAAFANDGVYISPNKGGTWTLMAGGVGDPHILEDQVVNTPVPVANKPGSPNGARIVLAKPALTGSTIQGDVTAAAGGNALQDAQYETWLYAASVDGGGQFVGLYITKDNGSNWTQIKIPTASFAAGPNEVVPTNNPGAAQYNVTRGLGIQTVALTVDPNNPMVVYLGGTDFNGNATTMIRVDIAHLADAYSLYASAETPGGQVLEQTTSPVTIYNPGNLEGDFFAIDPGTGIFYLEPDPLRNSYINLLRNPANAFSTGSTFFVAETTGLTNDGSGAWWTPFITPLDGSDNIQTIVAEKDPLTGRTRLLIGDDQGVFSGVDDGHGTLVTQIGGVDGGRTVPTGSRNGNLQISQFYAGAAQPSAAAAAKAAAAAVGGGLFYGASNLNGDPASDPNILTDGNLNWTARSIGDGTGIATDQLGSGTGYYSMHPGIDPLGPQDFFQVGATESSAVGRTFNLLQATGTGFSGDPQWPDEPAFNFAVNPVSSQDVIIGSAVGRLFGTEDQGRTWHVLAQPADLDSSVIPALAYGAPAPGAASALDSYMLVGTANGNIFVTFTGGGGASGNAWTKISGGLDGSPVMRIVTDPTRGTHDAFAVTRNGVYYNADTAAANTSWVNITGNLFQLTVNAFGDANLTEQQLQSINALAVDWRYVIPNPPPKTGTVVDPNAPTTHPVVYVAGQGGVFRSLDSGDGANTVWASFPDPSVTPVPQGNMPVADVTDLNMELGNIDPNTGHANVSTGANVLLATTYGAGDYAIHLSPIVFNTAANPIKVTPSGTGSITFAGLSEQSAFGNAVTVTIEDVTDPNNPVSLGTGPTDGSGNFSVVASYPAAPQGNPFFYDGARKIEIFATDASGNQGNPVTTTYTNPLPTPTSGPVFSNANSTAPPLTNAVVSGGAVIVPASSSASPPAAAPNFQFTVPNPGAGNTIQITLVRIDSQQITTQVANTSLNGTASGTTLSGFLQDSGVPVGTYTYKFFYTVTVAGQQTKSPNSPGSTVKVVAPVAAPNLFFQDDSGTPGDGITNITRPRFTGTAIPNAGNDPNLKLELVETGYTSTSGGVPVPLGTPVVLNSPLSVDPVNGQYILQPTTGLADGTYTLALVVTDAAGDTITSSSLTLTISTKGPTIQPTVLLLAASEVPANNANATVVRQPIVYGNTDPGATVLLFGSLNGGAIFPLGSTTALAFATKINGVIQPPGYYQAQLPSNLNDGTVTIYAFARNAAGNTNPKFGTLVLKIFSVPGDYTGVGKAGLAVYSPSTGNYAFAHAGTGITTVINGFGLPNVDIAVPGDYNGDGQTDPAIYRPTNGYWAIDVNSQAAGQFIQYVPPIFPPGPNVIPTPADFDTAGQTDPAIYTIVAGTGYFVILHNLVSATSTSSVQVVAWGVAGDTPVPGDYDGASSAQVAVYRPTTGAWYVRSSGVGLGAATPAGKSEQPVFVTAFQAGDAPVPANYDGLSVTVGGVKEGLLQEAIYRPSTETFYIYNPNTKTTRQVTMPKLAGQGANDVIIPASADFTGDGKADAAIFDQTLGMFEYINSTTNAVFTQAFYLTKQDIPLTAPEQYRANANAAQAALRKASVILVGTPASAPSGPAFAPVTGSNSTSAAVVVGATVPTGLTSTGKTSTLPPAPAPTPAPIVLVTSSNSINRPAQGATDSAIASLGKSYKGTFV